MHKGCPCRLLSIIVGILPKLLVISAIVRASGLWGGTFTWILPLLLLWLLLLRLLLGRGALCLGRSLCRIATRGLRALSRRITSGSLGLTRRGVTTRGRGRSRCSGSGRGGRSRRLTTWLRRRGLTRLAIAIVSSIRISGIPWGRGVRGSTVCRGRVLLRRITISVRRRSTVLWLRRAVGIPIPWRRTTKTTTSTRGDTPAVGEAQLLDISFGLERIRATTKLAGKIGTS